GRAEHHPSGASRGGAERGAGLEGRSEDHPRVPLRDQWFELLRGQRPPEQETLRALTAEILEQPELILVLDALGDRAQVEAVGQPDDGADDLLAAVVVADRPDEGSIDLPRVP